jgi:predicted ATPase
MPLLERSEDLRAMEQFLEEASTGQGGLVLLGGEAGVGFSLFAGIRPVRQQVVRA